MQLSLHSDAEGLLKTHVTWEEVEDEMKKAVNTKAHFGPNKKITSIGDMKGFMSRIGLIEPDWTGADHEDLPSKFILKISTQLAYVDLLKIIAETTQIDFGGLMESKIAGMTKMTRDFHNREVAMYKILVDRKHPAVPYTKIYATKAFSEENPLVGYIISDFIPDALHVPLYETIASKDIVQTLKAVGAFSAIGETLSEEQIKGLGELDFSKDLIGTFFDEAAIAGTREVLRSAFTAEHAETVEKMLEIAEEYYFNSKFYSRLATIPALLGYKPVLVHSDLWSSNMIFRRAADSHLELKALIDFQTVAMSNPGQDLGRCLTACLSGKERRDDLEKLLHAYYDSFVANLDGRPVPYSFDNLRESYYLFFPTASLLVLPGISPMLQQANIPEDIKEKVQENAMEKMVAMLQDFVTIHDRNKAKYPELYRLD